MALIDLNNFIAKHGVTMSTRFIPYSQSKSFAENARRQKERSDYVPWANLNWEVTIYAKGVKLCSGDYSAGQGHCPSYAFRPTVDQQMLIEAECETGFECYLGLTVDGVDCKHAIPTRKAIQPRLADVLASLALDAQAINHGGFEEWASDFGYCSDSRRALRMYQDCLETGLALRYGLSDAGLAELVEASHDY